MEFDYLDKMPGRACDEQVAKGIAWLGESVRTGSLEDGEYEIEGEKLFARVMTCKLIKEGDSGTIVESHRRYADIHMVLEGEEVMHWFTNESVQVRKEYSLENDVEFYDEAAVAGVRIVNRPGTVCVFYPGEVHRPQLASSSGGQIRKVVVKVLLSS